MEILGALALDHYLAGTAWDGALEERASVEQPDNFWRPVERDAGAHGRFDGEARSRSWQLWGSMNRALIATPAIGVGSLFAYMTNAEPARRRG